MIDHQTPVLHYLDACAGKALSHLIIPYARLEPHYLRHFRQHVIEMDGDIFGAAEHIDQIDLAGDVREAPIDFLTENFLHMQVIDGHGNYLEPH